MAFGVLVSQFHNNNLIHNLRMGVELVQAGVSPAMASFAMAEVGINAPAVLIEAIAQPGVMESMGAKPLTHARKDAHIAAHRILQSYIANAQAQLSEDEPVTDPVYDGDEGSDD